MANNNPQQKAEAAESAVLRAECDPSLKVSFMDCLGAAGFRTQTDAILTLARDFIADRIQYKDGILQRQEENSQPAHAGGQQGITHAHRETASGKRQVKAVKVL